MTEDLIGVPFTEYTAPSWDVWYMSLVYEVALKSKDLSSKFGALIVKDNRIISTGYNGLCSGLTYDKKERLLRPEKYIFTEHAERNAIYSAARAGISTLNATLYTSGVPCTECTRGIIQAGISIIVMHLQFRDLVNEIIKNNVDKDAKWRMELQHSLSMINEANIGSKYINVKLNKPVFFDGKQYIL